MDGGLQKYDFGALDGLADGIDGRVNAINSLLGDLRSQVNNLTSMWEGAANEGFKATQTKWNTAADDLTAVLAKISIAVKQTNADAQQTENTNRARW